MAFAQRGFVGGQDGTPVAERKQSDRRAIPPAASFLFVIPNEAAESPSEQSERL